MDKLSIIRDNVGCEVGIMRLLLFSCLYFCNSLNTSVKFIFGPIIFVPSDDTDCCCCGGFCGFCLLWCNLCWCWVGEGSIIWRGSLTTPAPAAEDEAAGTKIGFTISDYRDPQPYRHYFVIGQQCRFVFVSCCVIFVVLIGWR